MTLDLQHAVVFLKPDDKFRPDQHEFVTIGIQFFKSSADAFTVRAVWKNSPAESAGVLVGDRILSANGRAAADMELQTFSDQLHGPVGTPVEIEIERPAGKILVRMKTRELLCEHGRPR